MSARRRRAPGETLYRLSLRLHPRAFRDRYETDMLDCYREGWREGGGWRYLLRTVVAAGAVGLKQRRAARVTSTPGQARGHAGRLDNWTQDFRYAFRRVLRRPGFSLITILTLGLGLGANNAVFSVMHSVLLEPLPYDAPDELVRIYASHRESFGEKQFLSAPSILNVRERSTTLTSLALIENYSVQGVDITSGEEPERVRMLRVSADYFDVLRTTPVRGRAFERDEETGAARVAVVSERLWSRHLDSREDAVGSSVELNGVEHTVIGVMSRSFEDPLEGAIEVWLPIDIAAAAQEDWDNHYLSAIGRIAPEMTPVDVAAELDILAERHWSLDEDAEDRFLVFDLKTDVVGPVEGLVQALMAAVGFLLLLTSINVAGLFVAQTASRGRELALRAALGSGRSAIVRQLVVEIGVLSALGGIAGVLMAGAALDGLLALAPLGLPRRSAIGFPAEALWLSAGLSVLIGLAIGSAVALSSSRPALVSSLGGARSAGDTRRWRRGRDALVISEVALALVLLMSALVLTRSFERLRAVDLGIDPDSVATFQVHLPSSRYPDGGARQRLYDELRRRFREVPGVESAGASSYLPASGRYHSWGARPALGIDRPVDVPNIQADQRVIDGDYFEALGIALQRGRAFDERDDVDAPRRVIVSASLVRRLFPDEDPVGSYLRVGGFYPQIIGVVEDVPVTARGDVVPMVYHAHTQFADNRNWTLHQFVRVRPGSLDPIPELRRAVHALDPGLVLHLPRAMSDVVGRGVATERFAMLLLAAFAFLAVLLASLGLYGVLAHAVVQQRREIGVRIALGARPTRIRRMVVGRALALTLAGAMLGGAVAPPPS